MIEERIDYTPKERKILTMARTLKLEAFSEYKEYMEKGFSTEEIIYELLIAETKLREQNKYKYRVKMATFPLIKTLDTFEFDKERLPDLDKDVVMELASCKFVENRRNVVAVGNSGTGKSHLCIAIAMEAIAKGYTVKFRRASELVNQMNEAASEKHLSKFIKNVNSCDILLVDELGYLAYDKAGASLLFQVFAARYETKSTIVTSNLEFSKWISFLGKDEHMTSALIGRLVQESTVLNMNGENYRIQKRQKKQSIL